MSSSKDDNAAEGNEPSFDHHSRQHDPNLRGGSGMGREESQAMEMSILEGLACNYYEMIRAEPAEVLDFLAYFGAEESGADPYQEHNQRQGMRTELCFRRTPFTQSGALRYLPMLCPR